MVVAFFLYYLKLLKSVANSHPPFRLRWTTNFGWHPARPYGPLSLPLCSYSHCKKKQNVSTPPHPWSDPVPFYQKNKKIRSPFLPVGLPLPMQRMIPFLCSHLLQVSTADGASNQFSPCIQLGLGGNRGLWSLPEGAGVCRLAGETWVANPSALSRSIQ